MGSDLGCQCEPCRPAPDDNVVDDAVGGVKAGQDAGDGRLLRVGLVGLAGDEGGLVVALSHQLVVVVVGSVDAGWRGGVGAGGGVRERCLRGARSTMMC